MGTTWAGALRLSLVLGAGADFRDRDWRPARKRRIDQWRDQGCNQPQRPARRRLPAELEKEGADTHRPRDSGQQIRASHEVLSIGAEKVPTSPSTRTVARVGVHATP